MSARSRRRRTLENFGNFSKEEIFAAAEKILKKEHNNNGVRLLPIARNKTSADSLLKKLKKQEPVRMSGIQSLSLIIHRRLSKKDYTHLKKTALAFGHDMYASYAEVRILLFYMD